VRAATADRDDLLGVVQIDAFDCNRHPQDRRRKRDRQVLFKYGVESDALFRFVVGVDSGFFDERVQLTRAEAFLRCTAGIRAWRRGGLGISRRTRPAAFTQPPADGMTLPTLSG
jgi:hypothetical protein